LVEEASLYAPGCDTQRKGGLGCREGNGLRVVGPPWPHSCPVTCGSAAADPPSRCLRGLLAVAGASRSSQGRFWRLGAVAATGQPDAAGRKGSKRAVLPMCEAPHRATWCGSRNRYVAARQPTGQQRPETRDLPTGQQKSRPESSSPCYLQGNEVEGCTSPSVQGRTSLQGNRVRGPNSKTPATYRATMLQRPKDDCLQGNRTHRPRALCFLRCHSGCLIR
jgi:hypothetical protein